MKGIKRRMLALTVLAVCLFAAAGGKAATIGPYAGDGTTMHEHDWIRPVIVQEATCTETGIKRWYCTCGETKDERIPKTGHRWGSWTTIREATCTETGLRQHTCLNCGTTERETIDEADHQWGPWTVTKAATCQSEGKREHRCRVCGHKATQNLKKTAHTPGVWEIEKEPTCQHGGTRTSRCAVCGTAIRENLKKVGHSYGEWQITVPATDHSKGKRASSCRFCGKKKTEEFYPEGTLAPDLDNPPEEVRALQSVLALLGDFSGKADGKYGKQTGSGVKKFQKRAGLKQDGIAWPQTLALLSGIGKGEPVAEDPDSYTLQIEAKQTGTMKEFWTEGDELTFTVTVTNAAKKSTASNVKLYAFRGTKSDGKTDAVIAELGDMAAGETTEVSYLYTVSKDDVKNEKFALGFVARGKFKKNARSNQVYFIFSAGKSSVSPAAASTGSGGWTPPEDYQLTVTKTVDNEPENKLFFRKGETIRFAITVRNDNKVSIKDVMVTDSLVPEIPGALGTLKPGEERTVMAEYTVTGEDAAHGQVVNDAVVSYLGAGGKLKTTKVSVTASTGIPDVGLHIQKTAVKPPLNGLFYVPGEKVEFTIVVSNPTAETCSQVRVYDLLYKLFTPYKTVAAMAPADKAEFTFTTEVTPLQAELGSLSNVVRVTWKDPATKKRVGISNVCKVPAGLEGADGVVVKKTVISTPANGKYYQEGEEIRYLIEVTNNTVLDIPDMDVRDSLAEMDGDGNRTVTSHESLPAGGTFSIHFSYVVTEGDVENTEVTNVARAVWTFNRRETMHADSEPVTVPTAAAKKARKPKAPAVKGNACVPSLTAAGEGCEWREVAECEVHAVTAESSAALTASGDYGGAQRLWDADIAALYAEWTSKSDPEGARNAENEESAFRLQTEAFGKSLALVCSGEEADAILVEERMNKCFGLCYELHCAPELRRDSLTGSYVRLPDTSEGENCRHSMTQAGESAYYTDSMCTAHAETMQAVRALAEAAGGEAERAAAWQRAQESWTAELNAMYDAWYLSTASEDARTAIAADRISFDALIEARRATLADLYPDAPATAEEVLADMIMVRVETVCRVLHTAGILED